MEVIVDGAEQTWLRVTLDYGLLHHIEIGLAHVWSAAFASDGAKYLSLNGAHLHIALIQAVDRFESCWVREGQSVWSEPHHIPMLLVKFKVGDFWPPVPNINEPPPVCK